MTRVRAVARASALMATVVACSSGGPVEPDGLRVEVVVANVGRSWPVLHAEPLEGSTDWRSARVRAGPSERLVAAVRLGDQVVTTPPSGVDVADDRYDDALAVWSIAEGVATRESTPSPVYLEVRSAGAGGEWDVDFWWEEGTTTHMSGGVAASVREEVDPIAADGALLPGVETLGSDSALLSWLRENQGLTVPFGNLVWAVGPSGMRLFAEGEQASRGLEALAEDGDGGPLAAELATSGGWTGSGVLASPNGVDAPRAAGPGEAYVVRTEAYAGDRLHLAWMFSESNDVFFAVDPDGLALVDDDGVIEGEATVALWNAGTEVDEWPGTGVSQPPRQPAPGSGEDEGGVVHRLEPMFGPYSYPSADELAELTVSAGP